MNDNTPVEKKDTTVDAGTVVVEIDPIEEWQDAIKRAEKAESDRDNYRRVALARKKGEPVDSITPEEIERLADERAKEIVSEKEATEARKKADEISQKYLKENKELRTAVKNRQAIVTTPSSAGSSSEQPKNKTHGWTGDQVTYMKNIKKMDDAMIQKAWDRYKQAS